MERWWKILKWKEKEHTLWTTELCIERKRAPMPGYYVRAFINLNLWVNSKAHAVWAVFGLCMWNLWQCQTINSTHNVVNLFISVKSLVECACMSAHIDFVRRSVAILKYWTQCKSKIKCVFAYANSHILVLTGNLIRNVLVSDCISSVDVLARVYNLCVHLWLKLDVPQT